MVEARLGEPEVAVRSSHDGRRMGAYRRGELLDDAAGRDLANLVGGLTQRRSRARRESPCR
jgi:hypothetical protein